MKLNESFEEFFDQCFDLCYEFMDEDVDWESLDDKFWYLVRISRKYFQSDP